ncbi:TetR family transcriptional regulator [Mycolicibacterium phlei]|jgi:AcrR family transcriptional regulator
MPADTDTTDVRAGIRDAAIEQFGRYGFGTPVRAIADAAGVSPEEVRHLYGSKRSLVQACDEYLINSVKAAKTEALQSMSPEAWQAAVDGVESYAPMLAYLVRSIDEGGPAGGDLLDRMIDNTAVYMEEAVSSGSLKPSRDPRARAMFLVLNNAGGFLLYRHRHPTPDDMAAVLRDYAREMIPPALELYAQGLLSDPAMLAVR